MADKQVIGTGDAVEYKLSFEHRDKKTGPIWLSLGITSTVQSGESHSDAVDRTIELVTEKLAEQIQLLTN